MNDSARIVACLQAQLSRLEQRYLLDGLDMIEVIGRKIDQQELIQILNFDISEYGYSKKFFENVMAVSTFAVNPNTDLTTCRAAMAMIESRKVVGENDFKDDDDDDKFVEGIVKDIHPHRVVLRLILLKIWKINVVNAN